MFKSTLAALVALLILSSPALAAPKCNPFTVAGVLCSSNQPIYRSTHAGHRWNGVLV
jgi:hypothetical protein